MRLSLGALDPDEGYRLDAELVLETPFLSWDAAGEWHELDPGTGVSLAPVPALFGQTLTDVDVREHGALLLDFQDGAGLWIGPDQDFASWHLTGHGSSPDHGRPWRGGWRRFVGTGGAGRPGGPRLRWRRSRAGATRIRAAPAWARSTPHLRAPHSRVRAGRSGGPTRPPSPRRPG
ncbi:DUF6188 family protein [Streptomyces sp. AcE210]|uniref:DUF6188 family protein n=1 Tax=Streptomyces sp. AcE210 TaxID=2292703 RepID=UPI001F0CDB92|nr:DUF6188 family protein [Streptomyces sp. AcE210]